ncbi:MULTISPECIES: efflux RND transporter periplasmic adaptor subunit [Paenibacillus]|uniref:efflux RND transporter periplasmic adaptor subunit n=1 Tax=Paenibacillus TaxID=44249 RepID=UPI00096C8BB0|nr:efflux RND transporter periplasmic adaptor subunit [Paenibacillus peoriae]OMF70387.1 efflux transporter periplasmic adaptor subunit [Paenibacillus peoriae]OMF81316.1 efflux transporter periplasmic adaptor subunit [Paenibacillus peoriae]
MKLLNRTRIKMLVTGITFAMVVSGCSSASEDTTVKSGQPVHIQKVTMKPLANEFNLAGTLQASNQTAVSLEANGRILNTTVEVGDQVQKGAVLAKLDTTTYQLQLAQAKATLEKAKAGVSQADASVQSAHASIRNAQSQINSAQSKLQELNNGAKKQEIAQAENAVTAATNLYNKKKADAVRTQSLFQAGAVSLTENENAQLEVTNAQKSLSDAQEKLSLLLAGASQEQRTQASAGVDQARAGLESAMATQQQGLASKAQAQASYEDAVAAYEQTALTLKKATLTSPIAGVVIEKKVSDGQLGSSGNEAFIVGNISTLKVLLPVPDSEILSWKKDQKVNISLYNEIRTGTVTQIYPSTNSKTGSINVEVSIPNPELNWKPGQVISASKSMNQSEALLVPVEAVISTGDDPYVFKAVNGKAVKTAIKVGKVTNNQLEVVSGLQAGDQIVTQGAGTLFNGDLLGNDVLGKSEESSK